MKDEDIIYVLKSSNGLYLGKDLKSSVSNVKEAFHFTKSEVLNSNFNVDYEILSIKLTYEFINKLDESLWYDVNDHFE